MGWSGQDGVMARGMEAEGHLGPDGKFDSEALGGNRHATIGTDFEGGAKTPNIGPPGAARGRTQDGTFCFFGEVPSLLRGEEQFAVGFVSVAMKSQSIDVRVGDLDVRNLFAGEIGREAALPELVLTLHFSFGLRCWSIKETNVVKLEGRAKLGEGVGILGEKDGVKIDVDLERASVGEESSGQEIEVREEQFSIVEFGSHEQTAAIIEHIEHGKIQRGGGKPAMR